MITQTGFVMTDSDEKKFIEFARENNFTVLKKVVFDGEDPFRLYPPEDVYSYGYCIADFYTDNDTLYSETVCEGKLVKMITPYDDSMSSKPVFEFIRGRMGERIGTLSVSTENLSFTKKRHLLNRYKILSDWIIKNSERSFDMGQGGCKVYLLPEAARLYRSNHNIFAVN